MSDSYLRYVPANPHFQPTQDGAVAATALLRSLLPQAQDVTSTFFDNIEFIDAGGNWSGVHCPTCGTDAEAWWDDAMSEAEETQFSSLLVQARCCGATVSLNELRYLWPVAFASFVLEAENPSSTGLTAPQLEELASALGCPVREIPAHL
jgi:hypothetical protein